MTKYDKAQNQFEIAKSLLPKYNLTLKKGMAVFTGTGDSLIYYFNECDVPLTIKLTTQSIKNIDKRILFYWTIYKNNKTFFEKTLDKMEKV